MATAADVKIEYKKGVNAEGVTDQAIAFLRTLGFESGNMHLVISDVARTPYDQARIMHDNCKNLGVKSQRKLYKWTGDLVIDVYEAELAKKSSRAQAIAKMHEKILSIGPSKVSMHCVDTTIMNVFDIPFRSIPNKKAFRSKLDKYTPYPLSRYLDENKNNCFHLEFKLQDLRNYFGTQKLDEELSRQGMRLA